jgi:hypothetical protein
MVRAGSGVRRPYVISASPGTPSATAASGSAAVLGGQPMAGPVVPGQLRPPGVQSLLHVRLGPGLGGDTAVLEAMNSARDHRGRPAARLQCSCGGVVRWFDMLQVSAS